MVLDITRTALDETYPLEGNNRHGYFLDRKSALTGIFVSEILSCRLIKINTSDFKDHYFWELVVFCEDRFQLMTTVFSRIFFIFL